MGAKSAQFGRPTELQPIGHMYVHVGLNTGRYRGQYVKHFLPQLVWNAAAFGLHCIARYQGIKMENLLTGDRKFPVYKFPNRFKIKKIPWDYWELRVLGEWDHFKAEIPKSNTEAKQRRIQWLGVAWLSKVSFAAAYSYMEIQSPGK